jgi:4-hydroxyphenylpyruvate dioxygenase
MITDVAFTVDNVRGIYEKAVERGATSVREPWEEKVFMIL